MIGNEKAYPSLEQNNRGEVVDQHLGMTKRELFAAMALQGILASPVGHEMHGYDNVAREALSAADALLAELAKPIKVTP